MLTFRRSAFQIVAAFAFAATGAGCTETADNNGLRDTSATGNDAGSSTLPTTANLRFTAPRSHSGQLALVDGQLRFHRCGESGQGEAVQDVTSGDAAAILQEFGGTGGVTVLVQLHDNQIIQVRYAGPEGFSCERLPREGELTAQGNEPFWSVRIQRDTASYSSPETDGEVAYLQCSWSRTATGGWRYAATRQVAGRTEQLELMLTEERCVDSMSAARFPFRAVLVRDGTRMTGCALEGRQAVAS